MVLLNCTQYDQGYKHNKSICFYLIVSPFFFFLAFPYQEEGEEDSDGEGEMGNEVDDEERDAVFGRHKGKKM